jgi:superfamily I DNA/RNA helicase
MATSGEIEAILHPFPGRARIFLEGPPGAGKTTLAVRRMSNLVQGYVPAESILVLVPQRALGAPYREAMWELDMPRGEVTMVTVGGLARRMIELFWPLVAEEAGFAHPAGEPLFLTLETTQYYMDRVASPYIDAGYFDGLSIRRSRLISQIIDNLNKAAVIGFPHTEVALRLKRAWTGESAQIQVYDHAQACANAFRTYCLANNLLDFSLQIELFFERVLAQPVCRHHLLDRYRHLIVDNVEEDTPRAHDLIREWLQTCDTALIVMDHDGGYRAFLGADATGASALRSGCQDTVVLNESHVMSPAVASWGSYLLRSMGSEIRQQLSELPALSEADARSALYFQSHRFQPQMYDWVADQVARLIEQEGVPPDQIVLLAPFLGDALRFSLSEALARRNVPVRSHRPSRALRDEPAARCLLTLARLSHPSWRLQPAMPDVAHALMIAIEDLDLVRARLLTEITYRTREGQSELTSFDRINSDVQQRITYRLGERFEHLRQWLAAYVEEPPVDLDEWIGRLFEEVLSRPGFGFHQDLDAARVTSNLIESIRKFRRIVEPTLEQEDEPAGRLSLEYVRMVEQGIIAATYAQNWEIEPAGAVLMAPAYTFLMANRPVDVQFWLDVSSGAWWERLYQPLTHPYVLSKHWPEGKAWTDEDEFSARQMALARLVLGLVRRCRKRIYLGIAQLGEQGQEQQGPLLQIVQRTLRRAREAAQ